MSRVIKTVEKGGRLYDVVLDDNGRRWEVPAKVSGKVPAPEKEPETTADQGSPEKPSKKKH